MKTRTQQIEELQKEWTQPRWEGITRPYSAEEVVKLRGSVNPECTLAQLGAAKMWRLLHGESKKGYINSLGALTGGQALQQAKAGIEAVYLSGWQVAADANGVQHVSGSIVVSSELRSGGGGQDQQHIPSCRSDPMVNRY